MTDTVEQLMAEATAIADKTETAAKAWFAEYVADCENLLAKLEPRDDIPDAVKEGIANIIINRMTKLNTETFS